MSEASIKVSIQDALKSGPVIIYGAHLVAAELYRYLKKTYEYFDFAGFVVTIAEGNPRELEDKPVIEIQDCQATKDTTILIAMPEKYHREVEAYARSLGFSNFIKISLEEMSRLKGEQLLIDSKNHQNLDFYIYQDAYDPSWLNMTSCLEASVPEADPAKRHYKFPTLYHLDAETVFHIAERFDFYKDYEQIFGTYHNLHSFSKSFTSNYDQSQIQKQVHIYMVFSQWDSAALSEQKFADWIRPIQAGSILTASKANTYLDETGDNISEKNAVLAEMTAAYWIWKNAELVKYKGLCHYRRHFLLEEKEIVNLELNGIDVILTTPRYAPGGIKQMFLAETPVKEPVYQTMLRAVSECHPEDTDPIEQYMNQCLYCPNNMVIAKSEIYDAYCEWIFPVLFRMMEIDQETGYGHEKDRHIAYAAELLTSYYFVKNKDKYCVAVTDYRFYS